MTLAIRNTILITIMVILACIWIHRIIDKDKANSTNGKQKPRQNTSKPQQQKQQKPRQNTSKPQQRKQQKPNVQFTTTADLWAIDHAFSNDIHERFVSMDVQKGNTGLSSSAYNWAWEKTLNGTFEENLVAHDILQGKHKKH